MSDQIGRANATIQALRRTTAKFDAAGDGMLDFMGRQMRGEQPDSQEFMKLMEKRSVAKDAMQAQFNLHEKPLKTALNETK